MVGGERRGKSEGAVLVEGEEEKSENKGGRRLEWLRLGRGRKKKKYVGEGGCAD